MHVIFLLLCQSSEFSSIALPSTGGYTILHRASQRISKAGNLEMIYSKHKSV